MFSATSAFFEQENPPHMLEPGCAAGRGEIDQRRFGYAHTQQQQQKRPAGIWWYMGLEATGDSDAISCDMRHYLLDAHLFA